MSYYIIVSYIIIIKSNIFACIKILRVYRLYATMTQHKKRREYKFSKI